MELPLQKEPSIVRSTKQSLMSLSPYLTMSCRRLHWAKETATMATQLKREKVKKVRMRMKRKRSSTSLSSREASQRQPRSQLTIQTPEWFTQTTRISLVLKAILSLKTRMPRTERMSMIEAIREMTLIKLSVTIMRRPLNRESKGRSLLKIKE